MKGLFSLDKLCQTLIEYLLDGRNTQLLFFMYGNNSLQKLKKRRYI